MNIQMGNGFTQIIKGRSITIGLVQDAVKCQLRRDMITALDTFMAPSRRAVGTALKMPTLFTETNEMRVSSGKGV